MGQMVNTRQPRTKDAANGDNATDRNAAKIRPMIAALTPDQARAAMIATGIMIAQSNFQRRLDTLRTGIGEKDAVKPIRRDAGQTLSKFKGDRMAHLESRRIVQR